MIRSTSFTAILVLLSCSLASHAQETAKEKPKPAVVPTFSTADSNKDGSISQEEFNEQVVNQTMGYHDADGNKAINAAEAQAVAPKRKNEDDDQEKKPKGEKKPKARVNIQFKNIDVDSDGKLTASELKAAVLDKQDRFQSVFQLLDTNKDGKLTADEWTSYSDNQAQTGGGVPIFRISF